MERREAMPSTIEKMIVSRGAGLGGIGWQPVLCISGRAISFVIRCHAELRFF